MEDSYSTQNNVHPVTMPIIVNLFAVKGSKAYSENKSIKLDGATLVQLDPSRSESITDA